MRPFDANICPSRQVISRVDAAFLGKEEAEWVRLFEEKGIWYTRVRRFEDMLEDPQALEVEAFVDVPGMEHKLVGSPMRLSCAPHLPAGPAPALGAHTDEILKAMGGR